MTRDELFGRLNDLIKVCGDDFPYVASVLYTLAGAVVLDDEYRLLKEFVSVYNRAVLEQLCGE